MTADDGYVAAPLLSIPETAKYLGVGRKMVYELIERGQITAVKSGRTTLVEKRSLDAFKAAKTLT